MNPDTARSFRNASAAYRVREECAEAYAVALETRQQAQKALVAAASTDDKRAFANAVFASDRAEAAVRSAQERYRASRESFADRAEAFFTSFCAWKDIDPSSENLEGVLRESLQLVKGGKR